MLRLLSWFYTQQGYDQDKTTIVRCAKIDRNDLNDILIILERAGIIKFTRVIVQSKMYNIAMPQEKLTDFMKKRCGVVWLA